MITNLATAFGVKRGAIEYHQALRSFGQGIGFGVILNNRQYRCLAAQLIIARKSCALFNTDTGNAVHMKLAGRPRTVTLRGHRLFKSHHIHCKAALTGVIRRQISWKPKGIVESENQVAGDSACVQVSQFLFENTHALPQGLSKTLSLLRQCFFDT